MLNTWVLFERALRQGIWAVPLLFLVLAPSKVSAANSASKLVKSDPVAAYIAIKSIIVSDKISHFDVPEPEDDESGEFSIVPCAGIYYYIVPADEDNLLSILTQAAFEYAFAEKALVRHLYPEKVWRDILVSSEAKFLKDMKKLDYQTDFEAIAASINARRNLTLTKLPSVLGAAECSYDVWSFKISMDSPNYVARLIPKLFYTYCKKIGVDPLDRDKCGYWLSPFANGDEQMLAGVYVYSIERHRHSIKVDEVDVDRLTVGAEGDEPILLRLGGN